MISLAVTSSVAMTYFQALALQNRITVAQNNLAAAQQTLTGIQMQFASGIGTELNIAQQQTVVNELRASIPPLQLQLSQTTDALAILLGEPPENINVQAGSLLNLQMPSVAPGLPADLLARRPDVHEAEAQLIAANANIKAARAAFLPSFTLTGAYGLESVGLASFAPPTAIFAIAGGLMQPIFEGGALTGQLEYSKARYSELLDDYRKSIISALGNVEDGLASVQQTGQQLEAQTDVVNAAQHAYDISQAQYQAGTIDLLNVLTAETTLFQAQDMLIQVRLAHAQALVGLFQALGGGWKDTQTSRYRPQWRSPPLGAEIRLVLCPSRAFIFNPKCSHHDADLQIRFFPRHRRLSWPGSGAAFAQTAAPDAKRLCRGRACPWRRPIAFEHHQLPKSFTAERPA